jgi:hypothetical protein
VIPHHAKDLLPRLPRTFRPALNDQFRNWDFLFPAEQRALEAQLDWLARLPPEDFKQLFAPVLDLESRMQLPRWEDGAGLTVQATGILARSPLYPRWRAEVERIFSRIEEAVEKSGRLQRVPRLLVCVLPSGLPVGGDPYWPELAKQGAWVQLDNPFGAMLSPLASSLAARKLRAGLEEVEGTWILECDTRLSPLAESTRATVLSWTALAGARREFLSRLNTIRRDLASVDRTNEELKRMDLAPLVKAPPRIREFVRSVFLSGNGSLVFNNSFVQWGASEALRRVQPQVMLACFGIRPKLKPFSSVVLFEDQSRSNPVPEENDPAGSLADALKLAEYVCLAAQRLGHPLERRVTLMAACDLNRVLVIGAPPPSGDVTAFLQTWLAS